MAATNKKSSSAWSWKISDEELKNQVENYSTLPFTSTARGTAIIFVLVLLGITVVLSLFGVYPLDGSTMFEWVIYAVALFFISKGQRWAIILVMVLWTADKLAQLYQTTSSGDNFVVPILIWWLIVMPYLWKALRVENVRRKGLVPTLASATSSTKKYCSQCGTELKEDMKFCSKCGKAAA